MAKKGKHKGKAFESSHQRAQRAVEEARLNLLSRPENGTGNLSAQSVEEDHIVDLIPEVEAEIQMTSMQMREDFRNNSLEAHEKVQGLPDRVHLLFELTRDGELTPQDYHDELVKDPEISGDDVYRAISLGIKASSHQFLSKER